jgi:hypothetical protein
MVNMHGIVGPIVSAINPTQVASYQASTGPTSNADYSRTPNFAAPLSMPAQVQELSNKDLQHLDGLNLSGNLVGIYLYGRADGVVRSTLKGGDLITLPSGASAGVYLVTKVIEQWPDWVKVACTLQNVNVPGQALPTGPALGAGPP